jgi:DNA processing protein
VSTAISSELRDRLLLHLTPGLGPIRTTALLERFGTPAAILGASAAQLQEVQYIGREVAEAITRARQSIDVDGEIARLEKFGVRLIAINDPEYPSLLANIPDPPQLLYARGSLTSADSLAVAVVGSRSCTEYGKRVAGRLATGLARAGVTVVSGLPQRTTPKTFPALAQQPTRPGPSTSSGSSVGNGPCGDE